MTETKPKRRWFRFSLRTLLVLVLVTVAAMASWVFWIGWPWWQAYPERSKFEASLRRIHIGNSPADAWTFVSGHVDRRPPLGFVYHWSGGIGCWMAYERGNTVYVVYQVLQGDDRRIQELYECRSAEVFRLPARLVRICRRQRVAKRSRHDGADLMSGKGAPVATSMISSNSFRATAKTIPAFNTN